ncbi:agmatine deiminase family protein [Alteromonadaceae bacterium M269]|nr:agmatine deiminase family protein [Alteromonadaceae bacterium M269]
MTTDNKKLYPEWAEQEAVILAWPDKHTDWAPWLEEARQSYAQLIQQLNDAGTGVLLLMRAEEVSVGQAFLENLSIEKPKVLIIPADYNDTWTRDYAFLTCESQNGNQPIEFVFNGWGNKFDASKDNRINQNTLGRLCQNELKSSDVVAEGGALEIDEQGHLLSTASCLYNPERNGSLDYDNYQQEFQSMLGAELFTVLQHGELEGDDTDGHIDTLVRFTPDQGLVIQSAFNRLEDSHFEDLTALVAECREQFPQHKIYELPLPLVHNKDGERLPASYANFLISNQHVFCPVYNQPEDKEALNVIQQAFPSYKVVAIDCLAIVQQFGSLHCITMQVPTGTLKQEVLEQMNQGITCLA